MKLSKSAYIVIAAMLLTVIAVILYQQLRIEPDDFVGEKVSDQELDELYSKQESERLQDLVNMDQWVYWAKGGSVWHKNPECSYLSKSGDVLHGLIEDAIEKGAERPCSRCAK